jgi:hypothetical protein
MLSVEYNGPDGTAPTSAQPGICKPMQHRDDWQLGAPDSRHYRLGVFTNIIPLPPSLSAHGQEA